MFILLLTVQFAQANGFQSDVEKKGGRPGRSSDSSSQTRTDNHPQQDQCQGRRSNDQQHCRDMSNVCYRDMLAEGHSRHYARNACENVSTHCYIDFRSEGKKRAVTLCKNIGATCYSVLRNDHNYCRKNARKSCDNVSTQCFTKHYDHGYSAYSSIEMCRDVAHVCNE